MSKKLKVFISITIVTTTIVIFMIIFVNKMNEGIDVLMAEEIPSINLEEIEDGTYLGAYRIPLISVKVEVTVNNHEITEITILEHKNGEGADAEIIIDHVIHDQSIEIDFISGASYSSKAILLAIGDALTL